MSKRFGRKQKRKMLQTIEGLTNDIQIKDYRIDKLQDIVDRAADWDKEIVRLLGPNSALRLDTTRIKDNNLPPYMRTIGAMNLPNYMNEGTIQAVETSFYNIKRIMTEIKHDPVTFRNIIRLIVTDGKQSAMYVDEQYLQRSGLTKRDMDWLVKDIAEQLVHHMNKGYGHETSY